jgi:hypothetical protein
MRVTWDRFKVLTRVTVNFRDHLNAQMIHHVFVPINLRIPLNPAETRGDRNAFWKHINDGNDGQATQPSSDTQH